jgi:hypothetical protein
MSRSKYRVSNFQFIGDKHRPPQGRTSIWDRIVHFAGTETADEHSLEKALAAAERVAKPVASTS